MLDFGNGTIYSEELLQAAEHQANTFHLELDIPDILSIKGNTSNGFFDLVPEITGRNGFLLEAYHLARLAITLATYDQKWHSLDEVCGNFVTNCKFEDRKLKALLLRMVTKEESKQVTINWALNKLI